MTTVREHQRIRLGRVELVQQHERGSAHRWQHSTPKGNETPHRTPEQYARMLKRFKR